MVKSYHLKVIFDKEKGKLIYDRKLAEGSGEAIYGLEVCKSLDMDEEFLSMANKIRRKITGIDEQILKDKVSKYRVLKNEMVKSLDQTKKEKLSDFFKKINPIIQNYMDTNSIDILLERKNVFIGKNKSDITDIIIKIIDNKFKN